MIRMLERQRRRIVFLCLFLMIPLWVLVYAQNSTPIIAPFFSLMMNDPRLWREILILIAVYVTLINLILVILPVLVMVTLPFLRRFSVPLTIGLVLGLCLGGLLYNALPDMPNWAQFLAIALPGYLCLRLINIVLPRRRYVDKAAYLSRKSAEELWTYFVPAPEHVAAHWDAQLISAVPSDDQVDQRIVTYAIGRQTLTQVQQTIEDEMPHLHAYDYFERLKDGSLYHHGTYRLMIEDLGSFRRVTFATHTAPLPFMVWFELWLNDQIRDEIDHHICREAGWRDFSSTGANQRAARRRQRRSISPAALPA